MSLICFPHGLIDNDSAFDLIMAWCLTGNRPLSEPMAAYLSKAYTSLCLHASNVSQTSTSFMPHLLSTLKNQTITQIHKSFISTHIHTHTHTHKYIYIYMYIYMYIYIHSPEIYAQSFCVLQLLFFICDIHMWHDISYKTYKTGVAIFVYSVSFVWIGACYMIDCSSMFSIFDSALLHCNA